MQKLLKSLYAAIIAVGFLALAGCASEEDKEKAKKFGAETRQQQADREKEQKNLPAAKAEQEKKELAEKGKAKRQEDANNVYLAKASEQTESLRSSKDGGLIVNAATAGLGRLDALRGEEIYLGTAAWNFTDDSHESVVASISMDSDPMGVDYETVRNGRKKLRSAIIVWLLEDQKRLDKIWAPFRPILRQQYDLLKTLRGYEPMFKTPYTAKSFEPLAECLGWHEKFVELSRRVEGESPVPSKEETKVCGAIFKKFGVKSFFGIEDMTGFSARNAQWILKFLARRAADGDEKFAQAFQKLALDYIKP